MGEKKEKDWDRFEDSLTERYNSEGIAELGRVYIKNGNAINRHWRRDADDSDFIPIPIVALGVTAYLGHDNILSFRHSLSNGGRNVMVSANVWFDKDVYKNPNGGKDVTFFFKPYYDCCKSRLRAQDNERTLFPSERKTEREIILLHLENEAQFYKDSQKFYDELRKESERPIIETIRKAALYYPEWVKENYLKEENSEIENKSENGSLEIKTTVIEQKGLENVFCAKMDLEVPRKHFSEFTKKCSTDGKPFLTDEQFNLFIERAFIGNRNIPKQLFNRGEYKIYIQSIFHDFYRRYNNHFATSKCSDLFIGLLVDNFEGWDFNNVKVNFAKKPKLIPK